MPHDFELDHLHENESNEQNDLIAKTIWEQDHIILTTVGIDIGSSTTHLAFAKITLKRISGDLTNKFITVHRQIVHSSEIIYAF